MKLFHILLVSYERAQRKVFYNLTIKQWIWLSFRAISVPRNIPHRLSNFSLEFFQAKIFDVQKFQDKIVGFQKFQANKFSLQAKKQTLQEVGAEMLTGVPAERFSDE